MKIHFQSYKFIHLAILCILLVWIREVQGTYQQVVMYRGYDCSGDYQTFSTSISISNQWASTQAKSFKITGVWSIISANIPKIVRNYEHQPEKASNCLSKENEGFGDLPIYRLEMLGTGDTSNRQLTFFTESYLNGKNEKIKNDTARLVIAGDAGNVSVPCIAQFSNAAWILYSNWNFTGTQQCLCGIYGYLRDFEKPIDPGMREMPQDGYQVYNRIAPSSLVIGSVKFDMDEVCNCSVSQTRPTTMTTRNPFEITTENSSTELTSCGGFFLLIMTFIIKNFTEFI